MKFKNIRGYSNGKIKFKNIQDFRRPVRTLFESNCVRSLLGAVIYTNGSDTRLNSERVAIELGQLVFFTKPLSNN